MSSILGYVGSFEESYCKILLPNLALSPLDPKPPKPLGDFGNPNPQN